MRSLRKALKLEDAIGKTVTVSAYRSDKESARMAAPKLLGAVLTQAITDGMLSVSIGADAQRGEAWLRYFGPAGAAQPQWWEMTPPPLDLYPHIVQAVIARSEFEDGVPLRGILRARFRRSQIDVQVALEQPYELLLCWTPDVLNRFSETRDSHLLRGLGWPRSACAG